MFSGDEADARTNWGKALRVYRDAAGERITTSKDLCKTQATHLIERMQRYIEKQAQRAESGDARPAAPPLRIVKNLDDAMQANFDTDDGLVEWMRGHFGVTHPKELDSAQRETALQLLLARSMSVDDYDAAVTKAQEAGLIR